MIDYLHARRAIEALRAGVPNRDAVRLLGSAQPHVEARFEAQVHAVRDGATGDRRGSAQPDGVPGMQGVQAPGVLVAGDFGAGKSHLLERLQHLALEAGFVCSKLVISKETPLHDAAKLYRAAIDTAVAPDRKGPALAEIVAGLDFAGERYATFYHWAHAAESALNSRFPATLYLYQHAMDPEIRDRVVSFWSGDPLNVADIRRWLRARGEAATYPLERVPAKELPLQRFRFAPRLVVAAGYAGWVLLVDEVELIGRYSFMQRARSYAALARWVGCLEGESSPGLATVFAITSDFTSAVLEERNDAEAIPGKLRASGLDPEHALAAQAERGMRFIAREALYLRPPDRQVIEHAREQVRALHALAYRWEPAPLRADEYLSTTSMRQHVRRWINEWDLKRLDPSYTGETMLVEELPLDYSEEPALEGPMEGAEGAEGAEAEARG
jgi:hypothetical protein